MKSGFVFILMSVLMFSLVAGAGYNIVVPAAGTTGGDTTTGGGGGGAGVTTNTTADNETVVSDDDDIVSDDGADAVSDDGVGVVGETVEFIKNIGWKSVVLVLVSLGVIGGVAWYFLADKRKKFVEVRAKS